MEVDDGSGEGREACFWFLDADDARQVFAVVRAQNPGVEVGLGVTPLGVAFAISFLAIALRRRALRLRDFGGSGVGA